MTFTCEDCDKTYSWKDSLIRHRKTAHNDKKTLKECFKCDSVFKSDAELFKHVQENHGYHDGVRGVHVPPVSKAVAKSKKRANRKRSREESNFITDEFKKVSDRVDITKKSSFKFKHPFCMMVAGPSRSGKTQWVINLLRTRRERMQPVPKRIVYCYAHWQPKYDELKAFEPSTHFNKGLPYAFF